ncbi:alcohol dehydrogenase catalytic domain-containing protein [Kibdelosporangium aridum]|uniref:alcohol dehydrogenase catalytic domain-containing protein n=1 Tax=Kibdelosporangium aridum TaxID=2030 RepID=UPI0035F04CB0
MALGLVDPVVGTICGTVPFRGPFAIGHESVAEVIALVPDVTSLRIGQRVVVPWAVSCGACPLCLRGPHVQVRHHRRRRRNRCVRIRVGQRSVGRHGRRRSARSVRRAHARACAVWCPAGPGPRRRATTSPTPGVRWCPA